MIIVVLGDGEAGKTMSFRGPSSNASSMQWEGILENPAGQQVPEDKKTTERMQLARVHDYPVGYAK